MTNTEEKTMNPTMAPENLKYDDKVIKKLIATALLNVDGYLGTTGGLMSGLTGVFKSNATQEEEAVKGITADLKDGQVDVSVKMIVELGKNIPSVVNNVTESVTTTLKDLAGLETKAVHVEVADTMTRAEYEKSIGKKEEQA